MEIEQKRDLETLIKEAKNYEEKKRILDNEKEKREIKLPNNKIVYDIKGEVFTFLRILEDKDISHEVEEILKNAKIDGKGFGACVASLLNDKRKDSIKRLILKNDSLILSQICGCMITHKDFYKPLLEMYRCIREETEPKRQYMALVGLMTKLEYKNNHKNIMKAIDIFPVDKIMKALITSMKIKQKIYGEEKTTYLSYKIIYNIVNFYYNKTSTNEEKSKYITGPIMAKLKDVLYDEKIKENILRLFVDLGPSYETIYPVLGGLKDERRDVCKAILTEYVKKEIKFGGYKTLFYLIKNIWNNKINSGEVIKEISEKVQIDSKIFCSLANICHCKKKVEKFYKAIEHIPITTEGIRGVIEISEKDELEYISKHIFTKIYKKEIEKRPGLLKEMNKELEKKIKQYINS